MDMMNIRRHMMGVIAGMAGSQRCICECGSFTPETDMAYGSNDAKIPHSLGVKPDFIIAYADGIHALSSYTNSEKYICWFAYGKINVYNGDSQTNPYQAFYVRTRPRYNATINQSENIALKFVNDTWFRIGGYQSDDMLKGGITYRYVIGKYQE